MKQLAPNSMVQNRYLVVQMIGKGGMGEVYLAVDQRLGSAVALKRTFFGENGGAMTEAFEREAKILGRLRHPVLPKVIDHFNENGGQFLVMEHISGEDLAKRLENAGKPFPLSWVMFWADQLLDALNYLHSHEPPIIHRDIKPQNLKLTDENHIVLLDFGLSKDFDTAIEGEAPTTGSVVGYSPHFASMEQVHGGGTDARSDLYSLSATLYQFMTDNVPPDALSRADAMLGGSPDPIRSVTSFNNEVPQAISDVVIKGLAVRKDDRYGSAVEMQKALRRAFNKKSAPVAVAAEIVQEAAPQAEAQTAIMPGLAPTPEVQAVTSAPVEAPVMQADVKTEMLKAPNTETIEPVPVVTEQPTVALPVAPDVPSGPPSQPTPPTPIVEAANGASSDNNGAKAAAVAAGAGAALAAPAKKKSRAGLFIGGLIALIVLGGIAGGGGWFAYQKYYAKGAVATPTPSPQPSPTVVAEATPSTDSNSNTVAENPTNGTNSNTTASTDNPTSDSPTGPNRTGTTTQPGRPGQKPNTPPTAKQPPKQKGTGDRTVILQ